MAGDIIEILLKAVLGQKDSNLRQPSSLKGAKWEVSNDKKDMAATRQNLFKCFIGALEADEA